jgi:hypothetical protein
MACAEGGVRCGALPCQLALPRATRALRCAAARPAAVAPRSVRTRAAAGAKPKPAAALVTDDDDPYTYSARGDLRRARRGCAIWAGARTPHNCAHNRRRRVLPLRAATQRRAACA